MKRIISVLLVLCLSLATVFCISPTLCAVTALTEEELAAKNYPLPENTVVSTVINTFDTTDDCGSNLSTEEGTYYNTASKRIDMAKAWSEQSIAGKSFSLDGIGFKIWYKSDYWSILRIRSETNTIVFEANVPAHPDGAWLTYYYFGKCENFTFKSDMSSDIRSRISADKKYYFNVVSNTSDKKVFYFDEFFTIAPPITAADTYDNAEQFFKFSAARMSSMSNVSCAYSDDGSVTLSTLSSTALSSKSINVSYNIDAEQAAGAIAIANEGSGYLAMQCDIVSCVNSSEEDAYAKLSLTIGGIEKNLEKYTFGSGTSDVYLIKTSDLSPEGLAETLAGQKISIKISGSGVNVAKIKLSPITVHHFPEDELIVQAEAMSPMTKTSSGESDSLLYTDTDKNRTYVYNTNNAAVYISFKLPKLDVGEYEVYAVCSATKNSNVKYSVAINNLRQILNVHFTDSSYVSYKHITDISLGKIKITKDYSYGESYLKLVPMPKGSQNIYIDYFSFKKTDTQVTAEPESNFEIKPYPDLENYEVNTVLATYDSYICGGDERYYKENQVAGYVGDGNAFNLNSRGTMNKSNFDNNNLFYGGAGVFDGDGIRFWYKGGDATLIFYGNGKTATYKLAAKSGEWVTVLYKDAISGGDMSFATTLSLKTTGAASYYVDELHTIQQDQGDIIYELNGDGTASVVGYYMRLENVTVADTYEGCPVTTIKSGALAGTLSLKSVIIPDSVTTIESGAFEGDVNLKSITIGDGLSTIGENAFLNCKKLGETEFSAAVENIADTAFTGCSALVMNVPDDSYAKTFAMANGVDYRCKNAQFEYLKTGDEITLTKWLSESVTAVVPDTVDGVTITKIADSAFESNSNIESVSMSGVVSIGNRAFANCAALERVNLGNAITAIGDNAFANDVKILRITLPESLESISSTAFSGKNQGIIADVVRDSYAYTYVNTKATAMTQIPDTESDYKYSLYMYEATIIGYTGSDTTLTIPETIDDYPVIAIGVGAFKDNRSIQYVRFSSKCKTVGTEAFSGCSALIGFDIGGVHSINELSFYNCVSLGTITLTNVTKYEANSFLGCPNLIISFMQTQFSRTAMEFVDSWHAGINLGNTFDACNGEKTYGTLTVEESERLWGAPTTTKAMIDFLADSGFDVLRLPVTWFAFVDDSNNYQIDDAYMNRIKEVVDWAISNDMYVVLNVHHDTVHWLDLRNYSDEVLLKFQRIWEQIADRFKDYDEHLIFESLNEARAGNDWDGNSESGLFGKFNNLQKLFYNIVRNSGGFNDVRYLMLETYGAQAKGKHCAAVWYPTPSEDDHIIMSTHHYNNNIGEGNFNNEFGICKQYFNDNGVPCVIGETGRQNYWDDESQGRWTDAMLNSAENNGLKIIFWDDHGSFGMYDRWKLEWIWPSQIKVIMEHAYPETVYTLTIDGVPTGNGENTVSLPVSDKPGFICYTDGTNYYSENETLTLTDHMMLTSVYIGEISMVKGASIRLNSSSGIRFYTMFDSAKIAELKAEGATVELGTLIAPKDLLGDDDLTFDLAESKYIDVKYEATENGAYYWHNDVEGQIAGSIVNLIESGTSFSEENGNIARGFVGRGYAKVTLGGKDTIIYADYAKGDDGVSSIENNTRSLAYVADALKNDTVKYSMLDDNTKLLVDKWASKLNTVNAE